MALDSCSPGKGAPMAWHLKATADRMIAKLHASQHSELPLLRPSSKPGQAMGAFCTAKAARLRSQQVEQKIIQEQQAGQLHPGIQLASEVAQLHEATKQLRMHAATPRNMADGATNHQDADSSVHLRPEAHKAVMSALLSSSQLRRTVCAVLQDEAQVHHKPCHIAGLGQEHLWADHLAATAVALEHFKHCASGDSDADVMCGDSTTRCIVHPGSKEHDLCGQEQALWIISKGQGNSSGIHCQDQDEGLHQAGMLSSAASTILLRADAHRAAQQALALTQSVLLKAKEAGLSIE